MKRLLLLAFIGIAQLSTSQLTIDVMSYNVLNFPNGDASRIDTLKKVLNHYTPDLLLLQELKSDVGLQQIATALSDLSPNNYVSGTWEDQQSNPGTSWKLQQNIVYNTFVFSLAEERVITTTYRDVNYFKLYLNDEALSTTFDTVFIHVYVTHLKSSQGSTNEQLRLEMSTAMRADINALPANSYVLCGGDFNLYTDTEPAYQHLITTGLTNTLYDPIAMPGNWHDSGFPNKEILTQSTRLNALSDGAGGGLDDRFDFVLHSGELSAANPELNYVAGTYDALGNNGTCYNLDLTNCTSVGNVPDSIISALYYSSDHLPVVFSLASDVVLSANKLEAHPLKLYPNPVTGILHLSTESNVTLSIHLIDLSGKQVHLSHFNGNHSIDISSLQAGVYIAEIWEGQQLVKREKISVH
ncbi:MAG: endonuclease/exonuclease/phosphatase family metal-dependent hydrolase [Crocinitomicaceae bacterium]|jgi:endonuclease/exonuclease/phosphatase family metal-dependent hydrolase